MSHDVFTPPGDCPVCGAEVPAGSMSCPSCGADERTGWDEEESRYDGLDLPDEVFDDEFEQNGSPRKLWHQSALWAGVALVLLILFIVAFFGR